MQRHGESSEVLWAAVVGDDEDLDPCTIGGWRRGRMAPRSARNLLVLARIEARYGLPKGYFLGKLPHPCRSATFGAAPRLSNAERRRLAWHLPLDFDTRPRTEQDEILEWVRRIVVSGATEYRRYQSSSLKQHFGIRFNRRAPDDGDCREPKPSTMLLPTPRLAQEMRDLVAFKTAILTEPGYGRRGVWGGETASQKMEHFGLMLGALSASPDGAVRGYGVAPATLTLALLVFPRVWDWYLTWRERRRGFYTVWEVDMLSSIIGLTAAETGWLAQTPSIVDHLTPIAGLVDASDIEQARTDWLAACARVRTHALVRVKEIERVARVHRDPFEPILPVLEATSPLSEYRKIANEVVRLMPDARRYPRGAAEAQRSLMLLRFGLHLGVRQKNLRQLLLKLPGQPPSSERTLMDLKRGELRWSDRDNGWEAFIPANAFKNAGSSFFGGRPFRLALPDLQGLYAHIDQYVRVSRPLLLGSANDPGTFFVKTAKRTSTCASYDSATFYEAWRFMTQRYGVYNPYTGRGAIKGLLPHGPHNVRDVLATHILKQTGSFEQASYAIQDTPEIVAKHYGRFLPENKAYLAAQILNRVWEAP
ncbi:MAG: hypothetical protein WAU68_11765 [Vitreimonas sp.]